MRGESMSEKEKAYTKFKDDADVYFGGLRSEITDYVEELKVDKGELYTALKRSVELLLERGLAVTNIDVIIDKYKER